VAPGTYNETVLINGKRLTLEGKKGRNSTFINGAGSGKYATIEIYGSTGVKISGFTVEGDASVNGIFCRFSQLTLDDSKITNSRRGLYAYGNCHVRVRDTIVEHCETGMRFKQNCSALVQRCNVSDNAQNGMELSSGSSADVEYCTVSSNGQVGIQAYGGSSISLGGNDIHHNSFNGLGVTSHSFASLWGENKIHHNGSDRWVGIGLYYNSTANVSATDEIYENRGAGIEALMNSQLWVVGKVYNNATTGINLSHDSSALFGEFGVPQISAQISGNGSFGIQCDYPDSSWSGLVEFSGNGYDGDNGQCGPPPSSP